MTTETTRAGTLVRAHRLAREAENLADAAIARAAELTSTGARIDEHQVTCERLALLATEARAARSLVDYAERLASAGRADPLASDQALSFAAHVVHGALAT